MTTETENLQDAIAHYQAILDRLRNGESLGPHGLIDIASADEYVNLRYNGYQPWRFNFTTTEPL